MSDLVVKRVTSRRERKQFLMLPWRIYENDPHWVPPLLTEVKEFLDPKKHPFYLHGEAVQLLATRDGVPVGRTLVSDDSLYNRHYSTNLGCFGMFECVDDRPTAHALLDAAADWLQARGRDTVMGPIDYSTNYPCGLLVDGFDTPPRVMMNHQRQYYAPLLESWGLNKVTDLYAWWFADPLNVLSKWNRLAERIERQGKVTVRPFRTQDYHAEIDRCRSIYNASLVNDLGLLMPLTDAEFSYFGRRMARVADPRLTLLAEVDGKPVGFCLVLPDVNEAIRPFDGRLTRWGLPINAVRLLWRIRRIKTARLVLLHVLEGYRRRGIAELLILKVLDYGKNTVGYTGAELGWTMENHDLINRTVEKAGGRRYKTYRIYDRPISPVGNNLA